MACVFLRIRVSTVGCALVSSFTRQSELAALCAIHKVNVSTVACTLVSPSPIVSGHQCLPSPHSVTWAGPLLLVSSLWLA